MNRLVASLVALAVLALLVAGCGDDGEGDTTPAGGSSGSISKAEFVEQGNEICAAGNEELASGIDEFAEDNGLSGGDQPSQEQLDELASEVVLPSIAKQIGEIRDLGAPKGQEQEVEAFLEHAETTIEETEADPGRLTREGFSPFAAVFKEAVGLGLVVCAQKI